ncbi:hypothetical protein KSL4_0825 [Leuconostoc inhae]|uniref:Phage protein n=1 Tax=Leuconostoc inhae TaxID=178001 RepID=A0ABM9V860_9LACO|nr:hypothetical protein [Leuconostoc inhae]CUW12358.1 hypothetical protein KSL4_0825 [Leuconostoc inhae]
MYRFNFMVSNDETLFSREIENVDETELLCDILNDFIDKNQTKINDKLGADSKYQYIRQTLQEDSQHNFFIYVDDGERLRYDLNEEGLLVYRLFSQDSLWTITSLKKLDAINIITWDKVNINFCISTGIGAAGPIDQFVNDLVSLLNSPQVTAVIQGIELFSISKKAAQKIHSFSSNEREAMFRKLAKDWVKRGIYKYQLKDIISRNKTWNGPTLQKLLGIVDEYSMLDIMYSLGYKKIDRTTYGWDDSENADIRRKKWDQ